MTNPSTASPPANRYLAHAAWRGYTMGVHHLLNKPFNIEEDVAGRTPLLWAISGGNEGVMNLLIQKGASLDKRTGEGASALTCAVWSGNAKLVQKLLDKGFDLDEKDRLGKSALDWAKESGNAHVLQVLNESPGASHLRSVRKQEWLKERTKRQRRIGPTP